MPVLRTKVDLRQGWIGFLFLLPVVPLHIAARACTLALRSGHEFNPGWLASFLNKATPWAFGLGVTAFVAHALIMRDRERESLGGRLLVLLAYFISLAVVVLVIEVVLRDVYGT